MPDRRFTRDLQLEAQAVRLYRAGWSISAVANTCRRSQSWVYGCLYRAEVPRRKHRSALERGQCRA